MDNVLTAIFKVESEGFLAFAEIQEELRGELFFVPQMALVKYHLGYLQTLGSYESPLLEDGKAFSGGLFGSLTTSASRPTEEVSNSPWTVRRSP